MSDVFEEGDKVVTTDGTQYTILKVEKINKDFPNMSRYTVGNVDRVINNFPGYLLSRLKT